MSTYIQTSSISLAKSISFYKSIGFSILEHASKTFATDGKVLIEINPNNKARLEINIEVSDLENLIQQLPNHVPSKKYTNSILTNDPSGVRIRINNKHDIPNFHQFENNILGTNAGLSIETIDFQHSVEFYTHLGFTISQGGLDKDWIVLTNIDDFNISLMKPDTCPHQFSSPALTFFNGKKNDDIITLMRKENLNIIEEITHFNKEGNVDNLTIADPGGFYMFMFND